MLGPMHTLRGFQASKCGPLHACERVGPLAALAIFARAGGVLQKSIKSTGQCR